MALHTSLLRWSLSCDASECVLGTFLVLFPVFFLRSVLRTCCSEFSFCIIHLKRGRKDVDVDVDLDVYAAVGQGEGEGEGRARLPTMEPDVSRASRRPVQQ